MCVSLDGRPVVVAKRGGERGGGLTDREGEGETDRQTEREREKKREREGGGRAPWLGRVTCLAMSCLVLWISLSLSLSLSLFLSSFLAL